MRLQQCEACEHWIFFPRVLPGLRPTPSGVARGVGRGHALHLHGGPRPDLPEFTDEMPQLLAVRNPTKVCTWEYDAGRVAAEGVKIGERVRPVFDDRPGEVTLLRYTPAALAQPRRDRRRGVSPVGSPRPPSRRPGGGPFMTRR